MSTICIAGKNNIAVDVMLYCLSNYKDSRILCITDRNETGINSWQKSLEWFAKKNGVDVVGLNDVYDIDDLIFLSTEFDRIVKPEKFKSESLYNIHFSLLPKYKGVYTCVLPILNGEEKTGVTFHKIRAGIDTGEIIDQEELEIKAEDSSFDLYQKLITLGTEVVIRNLNNVVCRNVKAKQQEKKGSTYYSRDAIDYNNLMLDVNCTAFQIQNQIRAFCFRPYQILNWNGEDYIEAEILDNISGIKPGSIVEDNSIYTVISSVDYDVKLYKNVFEDLLNCISNSNNVRAKELCSCREVIKAKDEHGWTALTVAVYNNNIEMVEFLLRKGADVFCLNNNGTTLLMYAKDAAVNSNNWDVFELLLNKGLSTMTRDYYGKRICDYIDSYDYIPPKIAEIIRGCK